MRGKVFLTEYSAAVIGSSAVLRVVTGGFTSLSFALTTVPFASPDEARAWVESNKTDVAYDRQLPAARLARHGRQDPTGAKQVATAFTPPDLFSAPIPTPPSRIFPWVDPEGRTDAGGHQTHRSCAPGMCAAPAGAGTCHRTTGKAGAKRTEMARLAFGSVEAGAKNARASPGTDVEIP
jgi:hypothetical protein